MKILKYLLLFFLILTLSIVSSQNQTFEISSSEEQSVNVFVDDQFSLSLSGNPTTGYQWDLVNIDEIKNSTLLEYLNTDQNGRYVQDPSPKLMVGVGGKFYFDFKAKSNGKINAKFSYRRPWETESDFNQKVNVTIEITEKATVEKNDSVIPVVQKNITNLSEITDKVNNLVQIIDSHMSSSTMKAGIKYIAMLLLMIMMI